MPQQNLSPEVLQMLLAQQYRSPTSGSGWSPETAYGPMESNRTLNAPDGNVYRTTYDTSGGAGGEGATPSYNVQGYLRDVVPGANKEGDSQDIYDQFGAYKATGKIPKDTTFQEFLMLAAAIGGAGFLTAGGMGAGMAAGAGGSSAAGAGAAAGGATGADIGMMYAGADAGAAGTLGGGASIGGGSALSAGAGLGGSALQTMGYQAPMEGIAGGPASEFSYGASGAGSGGAAGAGAGAGGGGGSGGTLSKAALDGTNAFGANSVPGAYDLAAAPGASLLDSLGGAKNLLGLGATALGALAGSQGTPGQSSTSTRDIPEWLKPYATKTLGYASGLLDQQMAPGALSGYDDMKRVGQGLLNQPVAGNGFAKFFPGRI